MTMHTTMDASAFTITASGQGTVTPSPTADVPVAAIPPDDAPPE